MFTICDFPENSSSFQDNYANYFLSITMHIFTTGHPALFQEKKRKIYSTLSQVANTVILWSRLRETDKDMQRGLTGLVKKLMLLFHIKFYGNMSNDLLYSRELLSSSFTFNTIFYTEYNTIFYTEYNTKCFSLSTVCMMYLLINA